MGNEVNIKSSTIEKGLELIKDFSNSLLGPSIKELGFLFNDNVRLWRFKRQVLILERAQKYVKKKDIKISSIPTKILVPLLENASLEEESELEDKWVFMLGNLADSEQNLQNQIFPFLLGQISLDEFNYLQEFQKREVRFRNIYLKFLILKRDDENYWLNESYSSLKKSVTEAQQEGFIIPKIEDYEYSNLKRLGLINQLPPRISVEELDLDTIHDNDNRNGSYPLEAEYDIKGNGYRISPLGEKFLMVCREKKKNNKGKNE